jgi:hypothetical protein
MSLGKLIEVVQSGTLPHSIFHGSASERGHWAYKTGLNDEQRRWVFLAYNGSLDAAHSLHQELLPESAWTVDAGDGASVENRGDFGPTYSGDIPGKAARSWLLAILRAKEGDQP